MKRVYIAADNIISPLGFTTDENLKQVEKGNSGIKLIKDRVYYAAAIQQLPAIKNDEKYTRFERICIASINDAISRTSVDISDKQTIFILSSTKGNIDLAEDIKVNETLRKRISLFHTADTIVKYFGNKNIPVVVSNACISGLLAVITAKRLLQSGQYGYAVVTGADILTNFVVSGFQSLHAMSSGICKPFDKDRDGINLGECASTVILTTDVSRSNNGNKIWVNGNGCSNDASHISAPSRTGAELSLAINRAMKESEIKADDLSFISAHGTGTIFNDEMEAKAFGLSHMSDIPLNSLKANFGHTLGAAGVLESVLSYRSLQEGIILPSKNFSEKGVNEKITVNTSILKSNKRHMLKTASGFGGCNAAVVYSME